MTMICEYIAGSHYVSIKFSTELPPCMDVHSADATFLKAKENLLLLDGN